MSVLLMGLSPAENHPGDEQDANLPLLTGEILEGKNGSPRNNASTVLGV